MSEDIKPEVSKKLRRKKVYDHPEPDWDSFKKEELIELAKRYYEIAKDEPHRISREIHPIIKKLIEEEKVQE